MAKVSSCRKVLLVTAFALVISANQVACNQILDQLMDFLPEVPEFHDKMIEYADEIKDELASELHQLTDSLLQSSLLSQSSNVPILPPSSDLGLPGIPNGYWLPSVSPPQSDSSGSGDDGGVTYCGCRVYCPCPGCLCIVTSCVKCSDNQEEVAEKTPEVLGEPDTNVPNPKLNDPDKTGKPDNSDNVDGLDETHMEDLDVMDNSDTNPDEDINVLCNSNQAQESNPLPREDNDKPIEKSTTGIVLGAVALTFLAAALCLFLTMAVIGVMKYRKKSQENSRGEKEPLISNRKWFMPPKWWSRNNYVSLSVEEKVTI